MNKQTEPSNLEYENLEVHVDKCAMRYEGLQDRFEQVESRLHTIEQKIQGIHKDIITGNASMTKVLITTAGTVVAGVLTTITVVLMGV